MFNLDQVFSFHGRALSLRSERAELLANNLANVDTPNYHAKDIDFKTILSSMAGDEITLQATNDQHITLMDPDNFDHFVEERDFHNVGLDGNNVDKDLETVAYSKNAFDYQTSLSFLSASIKHVRKAIKGEI